MKSTLKGITADLKPRQWLGGLLLLSVLLRVAAALYLGDKIEILPGIFDQLSYDRLATNLVAGNGFSMDVNWWPLTRAGEPTAHWSYSMTFYLALVYKIFGHHPLVARLLQAVITGALTPWLVYRISKRIFRADTSQSSKNAEPIALMAACWVALYGYFIYYGAALMTEAFFILSILWSLDCSLQIAHHQKDRSAPPSSSSEPKFKPWPWIELGVAFSLAVLFRQAYLLFLPFLLIWLWWAGFRAPKTDIFGAPADGRRKHSWQFASGSLLAVLVLFLFILPFTIYNYQRFERFVLLNTNSGYAFFWANHPVHGDRFVSLFTEDMPSYQELIPADLHHLDEAALDQALMDLGLGFVFQDPGRYLRLTLSRIPDHFIFWPLPTSHPISNLTRVGSLGLALPFALLGFGFWFSGLRRSHWVDPAVGGLLLWFFLIYNGIYIGSWAGIRYRLPTDPVLVIFGAYGLYRVIIQLPTQRWLTGCLAKFSEIRPPES